MTKKDYVLIARAIKTQWLATVGQFGKGQESLQVHHTAYRICIALEKENARFDREKFQIACGIEAV